jgi:hypothetical protein
VFVTDIYYLSLYLSMLELGTVARQTRGGGAGRIQEADLLNTVRDLENISKFRHMRPD